MADATISDVIAGYRGIYARVAMRLGVDASYISRVADGSRSNSVIERELMEEIRNLHLATGEFLGKETEKPTMSLEQAAS